MNSPLLLSWVHSVTSIRFRQIINFYTSFNPTLLCLLTLLTVTCDQITALIAYALMLVQLISTAAGGTTLVLHSV